MTLHRCECCDGRRNIVGLGGMQKVCGNCNGVGHVKFEVAPVVVVKRKRRLPEKALDCVMKHEVLGEDLISSADKVNELIADEV